MLDTLQNIFAATTHGKKFNVSPEAITVSGNLYEDDGMKIRVGSGSAYSPTNWCHLRIRALDGCCGVLEVIRPKASSAAMMKVTLAAVWKGLGVINNSEALGNQLLATTSSESDRNWVKYLKENGWGAFPPAINPRTGNAVKIWRKVMKYHS